MNARIQLIILYSKSPRLHTQKREANWEAKQPILTKSHNQSMAYVGYSWSYSGIHYNAAQEKTDLKCNSREKTNKQDAAIVIATRSNSSWEVI